jgi:cyclohexanone monooxygenase
MGTANEGATAMMPTTDEAGRAAERYDVVVVGAGFNGLYQLYRLRAEGFSVRLIEAAPGPGGVWYSNSYPGARVDSHIPNYEFSMEAVWRDWNWSERFPGADELRRYFAHVVEVLDLGADIDFGTRVMGARFDDAARRWRITTDRGRVEARFLVPCLGFASKPYIPELPGLDSFGGTVHHTAQWPTGGVDLAGRRVGVIGTGASGVQVVQEAAKVADHLVVFQRTPVTALPMGQERYTPDEHDRLKRRYRELFRLRNSPPGSFADITRLDVSASSVSADERDAVFEAAWQKGGFHFWAGTFRDIVLDETANRMAYDFWRDKTRARIADPRVAEILAPVAPPYPFGTKRPSLEQDYYDVFNQANVELVDLRADPIEAVTPRSVRTAGATWDLDVLVLATGFDANTGGITALDLVDLAGTPIADRWAEGVDTQLGMAIPGVPNLLLLYGPQSPTAFCNGPTCAELQGEWVVELLVHLRDHGLTRIEATEASAAAWTAHLDQIGAATLFPRADSWYMAANIPGKRRQLLNYPMSDGYLDRLRENAAAGYPGFELEP